MKINGLPVIDADKGVELRILPRDVQKGDTKDPGGCAAALAAIRELNAEAARVHIGRTYVKVGKKWLRFQTSRPLRTEIIAFDRGGEFAPGTYSLNTMCPSQRPTKKRQGSKASQAKKRPWARMKRARIHTVTSVRHHGAVK